MPPADQPSTAPADKTSPAPGTGRSGNVLENEVDVDSSTCVDRIRYRLVEENGRYVFRNIEIIGDDACNGGFLEKLKEMTEGHSMDEIDLDDLERHQCARGAARSCYQAMGKILRDLREILP